MSSSSSQFEELSCGASEDSFSLLMESNSVGHVMPETWPPCANTLSEGGSSLLHAAATECNEATSKEEIVPENASVQDDRITSQPCVTNNTTTEAMPSETRPRGDASVFLNIDLLASQSSDSGADEVDGQGTTAGHTGAETHVSSSITEKEKEQLAAPRCHSEKHAVTTRSQNRGGTQRSSTIYYMSVRKLPDNGLPGLLSFMIVVVFIFNLIVFDMLCFKNILEVLLSISDWMYDTHYSECQYLRHQTDCATVDDGHWRPYVLALVCWLLVPNGLLCVLLYRSLSTPNSFLSCLVQLLLRILDL